VKDNFISGNTGVWGGGLHIYNDHLSLLEGNTVVGNSASSSGGGLYMKDSNQPILRNNIFSGNVSAGDGGGLYMYTSSYGVVQGNVISNNTASLGGGGIYMWHDTSLNVSNNTIISNTANRGGGVWVGKFGTLENNVIANNTSDCNGGGVLLSENYPDLIGNLISGNHAGCDGGGVYLSTVNSWSDLRSNTIIGNQADTSGGGVYLHISYPVLDNNLIADNQTNDFGAGLYVKGCTPVLRHNTIARNTGGDGSGIYVTEYRGTHTYSSTVVLSDTVLVGHVVGITVTHGNTATLEATLWGNGTWANTADWGGNGVILTGTINLWGDPAFVDPDHGDYHLGPGSAALDAGVDAGVNDDIDGEPRPVAAGYDIGADEIFPRLAVTKDAAPDPAPAGAHLTYTIRLTNTGAITFTATVTDILPLHVTPGGVLTWTTGDLSPGSVWTRTVVVTVEVGYVGVLTNVVRAVTAEGATGVYTETTATYICIPPGAVSITGPPTTTEGIAAAFTATVAPPTVTLPVAYAWEATGQTGIVHNDGLSDTAVFTWGVLGPQVVTVTATNGCGAVSTTYAITVEAAFDSDGDGISNAIEDGAPNGGDGNRDGVPDSQQTNVASLPNAVDGRYVTLGSPVGTSLVGVEAVGNPSPGDNPPLRFLYGFFSFTITGLGAGDTVEVTLWLPEGVSTATEYWKYGPTAAEPADHWYQVAMGDNDGDAVVTIALTDGGLGDDDLAAEGTIVDQGGPGVPGGAPVGGFTESAGAAPVPVVAVLVAAVAVLGLLALSVRHRL